MSQADPQSVKIGSTTTNLPRVSTGNYTSKYESADGNIDLTYSTQTGKRKRQVARIDLSKITPDPFIDTQNIEVGTSMSLVVDRPLVGFTNDEALEIVKGFIEALTKSEYAIITKLLAGES
jgi:hypothetical protein